MCDLPVSLVVRDLYGGVDFAAEMMSPDAVVPPVPNDTNPAEDVDAAAVAAGEVGAVCGVDNER